MGEVATKNCDEVIITNEDPYDEDPWSIIEEIASGAVKKVQKIVDRREAINKAISIANKGDAVIITGKGCEVWMCLKGGKKIPWDDRRVVREEFKKISL